MLLCESVDACLCSDAQSLGLKALRTWAFSDGLGQWNAIQPALGQINETVLSQVLRTPMSMFMKLGLGPHMQDMASNLRAVNFL